MRSAFRTAGTDDAGTDYAGGGGEGWGHLRSISSRQRSKLICSPSIRLMCAVVGQGR